MATLIIGRGHIIDSILNSARKLRNALANYNGHKGNETIKHIERNINSAWPDAPKELTGKQYGKLMSVANTSYHDGAASKRIDTWAYDGEYDWLAGYRNSQGDELIIEVDSDKITIRKNARTENESVRIYKLIEG